MKLLEQTVKELKGEELEDDARATVNLGVDLRIDDSYVPDMNQRLMLYRKVAAARRDEEEIDRVLEEAADRYGPFRIRCSTWPTTGASGSWPIGWASRAIDREGRLVVLKFRPQAKVDPVRLVALVRQRPSSRSSRRAVSSFRWTAPGLKATSSHRPPALFVAAAPVPRRPPPGGWRGPGTPRSNPDSTKRT